jgi:hypothetical protein
MTTSITISDLSRWASRLHAFVGYCQAQPAWESEAFLLQTEARFNELALELYSLQVKLNPAYAAWVEKRGPAAPASWREIPALPTSGFKELVISCLPPDQRPWVFHSSGTSQQTPSRHFHNQSSLKTYELSLVTWFEKHLVSPGLQRHMISLTPPPDQAPHSSLVHMLNTVSQRFSAGPAIFLGQCDSPSAPWQLKPPAALDQLQAQAADQERPVCLLGTAFNFVHLLDHLDSAQIRLELPPGSLIMETGGYKNQSRAVSKEWLHLKMTERLGVPATHIVGEYGMSELSSQAYDQAVSEHAKGDTLSGRGFRFPPWARALAICPETGFPVTEGQPGLLRIIDLANAWSVLAVQTEDLTAMGPDGFKLMGRSLHAEPRGCSLQTV